MKECRVEGGKYFTVDKQDGQSGLVKLGEWQGSIYGKIPPPPGGNISHFHLGEKI